MFKYLFILFYLVNLVIPHICYCATSIIPKPVAIQTYQGKFGFNQEVHVFVNGNRVARNSALQFTKRMQNATGFEIAVDDYKSNDPNIKYITLELCDTANWCGDEGYHLIVGKEIINIIAKTDAGLFYGIQTLYQLIPLGFELSGGLKLEDIQIECMRIDDRPRFKWRGMNLDCCRHFMDKNFIKRYIDLLAYHKMNVFHWHLTDDQGWRIEIKKYPLLTGIGAWRIEDDGSIYGGFYTQDDIKEIVAYAAERFITVVPEIEMPGHSVAALASYPRLSCTGGPFQVEKRWGVFKDIYCAGNDSTFIFIQDILSEVMTLFPSAYIHVGGDEAPKFRWESCPKCQERMKIEGLSDCYQLQSYFIKRIERFLYDHGKKLIGWDEILEGGLAPSATVQSWQGFEGAFLAASQGHDAIVSPTGFCYFDANISSLNLEKVYSFEPIPEGLNDEQQSHIIGGECCMWTENATQEMIDSKVFPRICALSEVLWSPTQVRNFDDFKLRMTEHYVRLGNMGVLYGYEREAIIVSIQFSEKSKLFNVVMEAGQPDIDLRYTTDGSIPNEESALYTQAFDINESSIIKIVAIRKTGGDKQIVERRVVNHLAITKPYNLTYPYSNFYVAGADTGLTDGLRGTDNFRDRLWQGFQGTDFGATVDLGDEKFISKVSVGFLQSTLSWIFYPECVIAYASVDGENWNNVGEVKNSVSQKDALTSTMDFIIEFKKVKARYIKIIASSIHVCPDWHPGAGGATWLFVDEIIVE